MSMATVDAKGTKSKKQDDGSRGKCDTCKQIVKVRTGDLNALTRMVSP